MLEWFNIKAGTELARQLFDEYSKQVKWVTSQIEERRGSGVRQKSYANLEDYIIEETDG